MPLKECKYAFLEDDCSVSCLLDQKNCIKCRLWVALDTEPLPA